MSATGNDDALANQAPGGGSFEFSASRPRDEPLTTSGHQPGKLVGNDAAPEFTAQTLPAGSAPASRTFQPNPTDEVPATGASATESLGGATSGDVHTGLGHPGEGQSSAELRHDGQHHRKAQGGGVEGRGGTTRQDDINTHDPAFANQRALDKDDAVIGRGEQPGAHERVPESAETVAREH